MSMEDLIKIEEEELKEAHAMTGISPLLTGNWALAHQQVVDNESLRELIGELTNHPNEVGKRKVKSNIQIEQVENGWFIIQDGKKYICPTLADVAQQILANIVGGKLNGEK